MQQVLFVCVTMETGIHTRSTAWLCASITPETLLMLNGGVNFLPRKSCLITDGWGWRGRLRSSLPLSEVSIIRRVSTRESPWRFSSSAGSESLRSRLRSPAWQPDSHSSQHHCCCTFSIFSRCLSRPISLIQPWKDLSSA